MLNITKGKIFRAQKVVIYGAEGIGKSSLAACFPDPLFIDTKGGTAHMDVRRIDKPQSWEELLSVVNEVAVTKDVCKTLVLDTADWAEQLVVNYLCNKYKQNSIESFGYGKGYTYLGEEFARLLSAFDGVLSAGIHIVVTAHAKMRKFEQPDEMGAYDRWEMKLSKQVAPILKEWCDILLFCNYQTFVVTSETNKQKAQGSKRVMYTAHHPAWDAKSRVKLPEVLELDYKHIAHIFEAKNTAKQSDGQTAKKTQTSSSASISQAAQEIPSTETNSPDSAENKEETCADVLRELLQKDGITETELKGLVAARKYYSADTPLDEYSDDFIFGTIIANWEKLVAFIKKNRKTA